MFNASKTDISSVNSNFVTSSNETFKSNPRANFGKMFKTVSINFTCSGRVLLPIRSKIEFATICVNSARDTILRSVLMDILLVNRRIFARANNGQGPFSFWHTITQLLPKKEKGFKQNSIVINSLLQILNIRPILMLENFS
jgi:hypothetical protein